MINYMTMLSNEAILKISIVKTIFIMLSTYYTNFKITNTKIELNTKFVVKLISIIVSAIVCGIIKKYFNYFISITVSIFIISIMFSKKNLPKALIATIISLAINYIISSIAVITNFAIKKIIIKTNNIYINFVIITFLHIILLMKIFKIKRLKYGLSFLEKDEENEYMDILILNISVIILMITIIIVNSNVILGMNLLPNLIIATIIMFVTIQKSLQLYYKQELLIQDLNETKEELEKTKGELKQVEEENLGLSKKSHSIAHKQKALEYKMQQLLTNVEISKEDAGEVQDRIKEIEKDLYKDKVVTKLSKTDIPNIDDMLEYMQSECMKNKIEFELQISGNIHYMVNNLISKEDLEILLADHIKDAIIAINHTDNINRSILVRLGEIDGIYSLYIYDSGIEFEKETLAKLGKKPITTHANEGGTGMGFMNTFDTLKKYQSSFIINELSEPNKDNYTKVLVFKFDKRNEFKIMSYRQ